MIWLLCKELKKWNEKQISYIRCKLIQTWTPFFILKAYTIQSLSQTNVQILQCPQSLSEIVGYHRDLVVGQGAKEIEGKQISYIRCKFIQTGTPFFFLKAYTIQSLSQTNVQSCQCRQSLSEIVGYHRDLVALQLAKEIKDKPN